MTLVAMAGASWGVRLTDPLSVLPHGLVMSIIATLMVGFAGWHGGKLVFDHGIGILVSSGDLSHNSPSPPGVNSSVAN